MAKMPILRPDSNAFFQAEPAGSEPAAAAEQRPPPTASAARRRRPAAALPCRRRPGPRGGPCRRLGGAAGRGRCRRLDTICEGAEAREGRGE